MKKKGASPPSFSPLSKNNDCKNCDFLGHLDLYGDNTYHGENHFGGKGRIMPVLMEKQDKQCRMDVRLTQSQRAAYERAASLKGQTLTQWATAHLDENARRDIETATTTVLSDSAFDEFCAMLDAPMPKAMQDLLARKAVWG